MTSKLEDLIAKLCPNGVEYKTIGTICETLKKATLKKGELKSEGYPVINSGRTLYGYYDKYNNEGPAFTVAARGEYAAFVNYFDKRFWAGGLCYPYKSKDESKTLTKFIYYSLKNIQQRIRDGIVAEGSIPALNKSDFENIKLLVPPLEVQREIVLILDNFTELTAELTAELTSRKKQYEYYRDALLTFDDNNTLHSLISRYCPNGVEYKTLKEILTIKNGRDYKHLQEGKYPVYGSGGIMTYVSEYTYAEHSVLIPRKGSINKIYYVDEPFWNVDTIFYTIIRKNIAIPKYVYFCLLKEHLERYNTAGGVPSLTQSVLNDVTIPIPPLEVQRQIVQILDRFDALCNDLTQGLPAEIEARRKQYEYYRDQLLNFKRA